MKIEKPDWEQIRVARTQAKAGAYFIDFPGLDNWFQENVEPVNKMLEDAIEVYGGFDKYTPALWCYRKHQPEDTKKALLINVQEIKPKTREERAIELLEDMTAKHEYGVCGLGGMDQVHTWMEKAKQILEEG